jgi:hypothetical protein
MNPYMTQSLVSDHIRELRQQAAARRAGAVRSAARKASTAAARRGRRLAQGA